MKFCPFQIFFFISSTLAVDYYVDQYYINSSNIYDGSLENPFKDMTFLFNLQGITESINVFLVSNITISSNISLFQMNVSIK